MVPFLTFPGPCSSTWPGPSLLRPAGASRLNWGGIASGWVLRRGGHLARGASTRSIKQPAAIFLVAFGRGGVPGERQQVVSKAAPLPRCPAACCESWAEAGAAAKTEQCD